MSNQVDVNNDEKVEWLILSFPSTKHSILSGLYMLSICFLLVENRDVILVRLHLTKIFTFFYSQFSSKLTCIIWDVRICRLI